MVKIYICVSADWGVIMKSYNFIIQYVQKYNYYICCEM